MWDEAYDYYLEDIYDLRYEYHDYGDDCAYEYDPYYDDMSDDEGIGEEV